MNKPNKSKRERLRRYGFIVSNPFLATASSELKVLDPNNLTDEQKLLLSKTQRDYSDFKKNGLEKYFDFALCEYDLKENKEVIGKVVAERIFFKSNELAQEFFKFVYFIEYLCYQVEIGEEGGVQHFQGFMRFKQPMDFEIVHTTMPMLSLYICDGSNTDNRTYCMKEKTKDPNYEFFEFGEFKEERQRTDMTEFRTDVINNMPIDELFIKHPNLTLTHFNKITALQQAVINQKYKNEVRQLHTTN
ncbi:MAG: hypothetical protein LBP79_00890 [Clostridiales bacterium]|jgi:hypothetical protein|nr:hypothetical protein [Clostridiales bacterium]